MLVLALATRWLLATVLVPAGAAKLGRTDSFGEAISRYGLVPPSVVPMAARVIPVVEILLGVGLAAGLLVARAAAASAVLFAMFGAAVAVSLARGRRFDCGCGLSAGAEIAWWHVGRSALLVGLGVLVAVEPAVLAVNAARVAGSPATTELIAVPLGVLLMCVTSRLMSALRDTASIVRKSRLAPRAVPRPTIREV